ncbi:hypothetical protein BCR42DRAFT_399118 [Absidia repens]|uniref:Uncharacterized protein n=1 Tax=Absidia repens TaxID=90262 RepID=A0A1X2HH66_9FUNG|nr:hypothetical protein BCR42DRAFT_399118 [Absidia repens]
MVHDDSKSKYDWWKNLQQLDIAEVRLLIDVHPHLVWSRMTDPVFRPAGGDTFLATFGGDLGSCLDDLNSLHWLLFYYQFHNDVKILVLDLLDKITMEELALNERWGSNKNTLLHLVSALGYDDLAILLLEKGVRADVPNTLGRLPYHVAQTDSMASLLHTNDKNKKSDDSHDSALSGMAQTNKSNPGRSQQLQQVAQPMSSTNTESLLSSGETATIKKPNKDGHYFRAGHVEETKQKVLTDEQVELQKQRERRRKDIALLAKRSAVKNNPFIKKSEPSLAQTGSRHGSLASSASASPNYTATTNDTTSSIPSSIDPIHDRKHKRNSKVINSLQTKSYVSSSIFRQGQPSGGNLLRQHFAQAQNDHSEHDLGNTTSTDTNNTPDPINNHTLDPLQDSLSTLSTASNKSSVTRIEINDSKDGGNGSDLHIGITDKSLTNDTQQQNGDSISTPLEHKHEKSMIVENLLSSSSSPSPSTTSSSASASPSVSASVSTSISTSTNDDLSANPHESKSANADLASPTTTTSMTSGPSVHATNGSPSRTKNITNKRQSGSQKTHWSKELASWESELNREFSLEEAENEANGSTTSIASLDTALANTTLKNGTGAGVLNDIENGDNHLDSHYRPSGHHVANNKLNLDQQQRRQRYNKHESDDDTRRQGTNGTIFESSRLPLKSYGSVSVKSMATYTRRLPTFDTSTDIVKNTDSATPLSQIDNRLENSGNGFTTTATLGPSKHRRHQSNHRETEMTRSASVSDTSSSSSSTQATSYYHQHSQQGGSLTIPAHLTSDTKWTSSNSHNNNISNINCGRGKLYIRVHGVHDILLPLPRDRAHVRCVIGDGRYEYMSRYEALGQDMAFGYECIIDSHPDMIVTLSLHVRPDYMLKKPLTRLFSTSRKRKGSLSAYVSSEDGAVGQTRFAVGDMLSACHRRSYSASFHCFNACRFQRICANVIWPSKCNIGTRHVLTLITIQRFNDRRLDWHMKNRCGLQINEKKHHPRKPLFKTMRTVELRMDLFR